MSDMTTDHHNSPLPYRLRQPHSHYVDEAAAEHIEQLEAQLTDARRLLMKLRDATEIEDGDEVFSLPNYLRDPIVAFLAETKPNGGSSDN
jgi:hypothetical protein